ncbi:MAG: cation-transporting P-type ATPase [Saprospirales bacterium]|nr:MAG: cation-transporting P-type ATPase [Saprospirales bacterium]
MEKLPKKGSINWHTLSAEKSLKLLDSHSEKGLNSEVVSHRLEHYGKNQLPVESGTHAILRFLRQFHNILIYVLILAAVITAFLDHWIDTFVILAVVLVNAIVGFIQEGKAERAIEQLQKMLSPTANVIRNGRREEIPAEDLVPGDLVLLKSGDRVPADLRIIDANNLQIEEAMLTGESHAAEKNNDIVDDKAVLGDRTNLAFSGTMVTYGRGRGLVVETGLDTELGKIRDMISEVEKLTTPLLRKMDDFARKLSIVIVVMAALILLFGWLLTEEDMTELFLSVIALAVAAIPEGLPAIMTITLAIGVSKMAGRNAIIRKLPAVETLGSVSVICTDKTGTLTRNEMMVTKIYLKDQLLNVSGEGYAPKGEIRGPEDENIEVKENRQLMELLESAFYCNDAEINQDENKEWILNGEPTEGALFSLGKKAGLEKPNGKRLQSIPFESENKYMAVLHQFEDNRQKILVKGAAERIIEFSNLSKEDKEIWKNRINDLASNGLRVLAFGSKTSDSDQKLTKSLVEKGLSFHGVVGIIDPPRSEAIQAITDCKNAGIIIKMITGDHAITASAIGKKIGIDNSENVITGEELNQLKTDEEWEEKAMDYCIFARTNPEHKLRLVEALQRRGKVVAMTGDGVNDAPALKRADVGVAMGIKGTEVTKNAAEMVLADDNFQSIASAVEEGRTIYNNLRKAILFILPTNGAEALMVMSSILVGFTLPITPVQVLWVNMVTAVTLALALAFEPPERTVMKVPPRSQKESIVGNYFLWRIIFVSFLVAGFSILLFFYFKISYSVEFARTIALNTLVAGQVFYLFNSRYLYESCLSFEGIFGNLKVLYAAGILLLLQLCLTYLPFLQNWFQTESLSPYHWLYLSIAGLTVFLLVEFEKFIYRKFFYKAQVLED